MNYRITTLFVLISLATIPYIGMSQVNTVKDSTSFIEEKSIIPFTPDSTVCNILILHNRESSIKFYPEISSIEAIDLVRGFPYIGFLNRDENEYLVVYQYYGGTKNAFSCFEIGYADSSEGNFINTHYKNFYTESGISLGMAIENLIEIKGNTYQRVADKIIYKLNDFAHSEFLIKHNIPIYFMECSIKDGRLVKIVYGFEYP